MSVDGYRFVDGASRRVMRAWEKRERPLDGLPWTPITGSLTELRVALITTAAVVHVDDEPFDQEGERRNPWWGDPSYRILPSSISTANARVDHLHIDPRPAALDLNCLMPVDRLRELAEDGIVGSVAPRHYSFMGYHLDATDLVTESAPRIAEGLIEDGVDLALLVPV